jgi:3-isopropylmalate/(R)-2-methylmalate dehydratase small subunit
MSAGPVRITRVDGRALPIRGDDVDTDRIVPARFLRAITFEGMEAHLFEDERAAERAAARTHPVDNPAYAGARVLIVGRNFGCGSSREHAPQAIRRFGIEAVVGESFSGIFFGNAVAIGLPCVSLGADDIARLWQMVERDPATDVVVDLEGNTVTAGSSSVPCTMPAAARDALLSGAWDATGLLLADFDEVRRVAASLPYISGF